MPFLKSKTKQKLPNHHKPSFTFPLKPPSHFQGHFRGGDKRRVLTFARAGGRISSILNLSSSYDSICSKPSFSGMENGEWQLECEWWAVNHPSVDTSLAGSLSCRLWKCSLAGLSSFSQCAVDAVFSLNGNHMQWGFWYVLRQFSYDSGSQSSLCHIRTAINAKGTLIT